MSETQINGGTYWLFVDPAGGTTWNNLVCLISHSFTLSNSTTSRQTYCGPKSTPGDQTQSIAFDGETMLDADTGRLSGPDIFSLAQSQAEFSWMIAPETVGANDYTQSGLGYFSAFTQNYSASDVAKFSGTISVNGDVTQVYATGS